MKRLTITAMLSLLVLSGCQGEPVDGQYAEIAQCLTEKGVKMYGAFWCSHCENQKKTFGDDFRYITYVECDPRGENADKQECDEKGITNYPTWMFPGQDNIVGEQSPEELAKKANCEAPSTDAEVTANEGS